MLVEEIKVQMLRERWGMASPDLFLQWHLLYSGNICLPRPAVTRGLVVLVKDEEWVGCH